MLNQIIKNTQAEITDTLPSNDRANEMLKELMNSAKTADKVPDEVWILKAKLETLIKFRPTAAIPFIPDQPRTRELSYVFGLPT